VSSQFGGGGQVRLDDGEISQAGQDAPGAAGGSLLEFDGPDVAFCLVMVRAQWIDHQAQDGVLVWVSVLRGGLRACWVRYGRSWRW
jgi:hypothetical protein